MVELNLRADIRGDKDEYIAKIVDWVSKYGDAIGCYEHPNDVNPHVHLWFKTERTENAVRENFKIHFPDNKGNDGYSLKIKEGSLRYIAKGERYPEISDPVIIVNKMFPDADVATAHAQGWEKMGSKKRFTSAGTKANTDEERETSLNAITRAAKQIDLSHLWSYYDCFTYVTRWYRQNIGQMPQAHYGKSLVDGLYLNLGRDKGPYVGREKMPREREAYIYRRWYGNETGDDQVNNILQ